MSVLARWAKALILSLPSACPCCVAKSPSLTPHHYSSLYLAYWDKWLDLTCGTLEFRPLIWNSGYITALELRHKQASTLSIFISISHIHVYKNHYM
jgi:hypothetical protein